MLGYKQEYKINLDAAYAGGSGWVGHIWNLKGKSSVNSAIELFHDFKRELTSKVPAVKQEIPVNVIADVCFVTYKLHRHWYMSTKMQQIMSE